MATAAISPLQTQAAALRHAALAPSATATAAAASHAQGKASFDDLAGMDAVQAHLPKVRVPLTRRLSRTQSPQPAATHDDHDTALKTAAAQLIESLSQHGDDGLERGRDTDDALQRQMLLEQAREMLDLQPDDGSGQREAVGAKLDAMQAALTARHGPAIAQGRHHADAFEGALAALHAAAPAAGGDASLSALRRQFGAVADGGRAAPLAPTALLDILLSRAGKAGAAAALGRPPAQLHAELRQRGRPGPRLWLSLKDAACFQLVNTSFALAGELRREVSEQAATAPLAAQDTLARLLLRLGEPDVGQAEPLLRQLADMERLTPRQRAGACGALRGVIARCPDAMWGGEALPQRKRLLDQLKEMTVEQHAALPTVSSAPADALQARLRHDHHTAGST